MVGKAHGMASPFFHIVFHELESSIYRQRL